MSTTEVSASPRQREPQLTGQTVVLLGGSAGIGLETARLARAEGVVAEYQRALAAGDLDAITATFESDGYAREPSGREHVHRGREALRLFYERCFSNGGGIELEHCALVHDGRACALEYNVVRWGRTELPPEAGVAVYVQGESGQMAAARIYDDADPPIS